MNDIETAKQILISHLQQAVQTNLNLSPQLYFVLQLKSQLNTFQKSSELTDKLIAALPVNLSGLGQDYRIHQEFLFELAELTARFLLEFWLAFRDIGEEYVINQVKQMNINLE